jgi:hypothetical protein
VSDPITIKEKLAIAQDARAKGHTLYRHQQALAARESTSM